MAADLAVVSVLALLLLAIAVAGWAVEARLARRWKEKYLDALDRYEGIVEALEQLTDPDRKGDVVQPTLTLVHGDRR